MVLVIALYKLKVNQVLRQTEVNLEMAAGGGNYREVPYQGGFNIIGLPTISGDFTLEFWHYYSGYTLHGGLILCVTEYDEDSWGNKVVA
jgi:hypothetical protein